MYLNSCKGFFLYQIPLFCVEMIFLDVFRKERANIQEFFFSVQRPIYLLYFLNMCLLTEKPDGWALFLGFFCLTLNLPKGVASQHKKYPTCRTKAKVFQDLYCFHVELPNVIEKQFLVESSINVLTTLFICFISASSHFFLQVSINFFQHFLQIHITSMIRNNLTK